MTILGIETSCDETALALIESRERDGKKECRVINSLVHSQASLHSAYGGVYPNLAKREHSKNLVPLLQKLFDGLYTEKNIDEKQIENIISTLPQEIKEKNVDLIESISKAVFIQNRPKIDAIAVTEGPGLEPALWVGINFARILGEIWHIPVYPINHMEGHIVASLLDPSIPYGKWQTLKQPELPAIALLVSGGHTQLVLVHKMNEYEILGETVDDALGEAFDKVARILELPYPGGPHIAMLAKEARDNLINAPLKLPRPMININNYNFSFSGLKTAVLYAVQKAKNNNLFDNNFKSGLAKEFEDSITETITFKLMRALHDKEAQSIIVGGGVSANQNLRDNIERTAREHHLPLYLPANNVSGDNALMIALSLIFTKELIVRPLRAEGTKRLTNKP